MIGSALANVLPQTCAFCSPGVALPCNAWIQVQPRGDSSMHEHFVIADKPLFHGQQGNSSHRHCHLRYASRLRPVPFSAGRRAGYKVRDSSEHNLLCKILLARNKRDLVAATEMPASSAISFTERSLD